MTKAREYERTTPQSWIDDVASWPWQEWTINGTLVGWVKTGECPRCRHPIAVYQEIVYGVLPSLVVATCNCEEAHPGRPADLKQGCGQHGRVLGEGSR